MNLQKKNDEVCEVACVKFGGFRRFKDETKKFLLYNQYLTLIIYHAKEDPRKALMKTADFL